MSWKHFRNSLYKKRFFDIEYGGTEIHIVVKVQFKQYHKSVITVTWSAAKFKGSQFEIVEEWQPTRVVKWIATPAPPYKAAFKKLRASLAYGLNVKSRAVTEKLMSANGQVIPHKRTQRSGRL